jgi:hypothetical protein
VSDGPAAECGRFPVRTTVCPTCSSGIKPALGWTWIDGDAFKATAPTCVLAGDEGPPTCRNCDMSPNREIGRAGLLWVGTMYYVLPDMFTAEAESMGVSRRIPYVPRGFEVGQSLVFLGHRHAVACGCVQQTFDDGTGSDLVDMCETCGGAGAVPGLFALWRPSRLEKIVDENTPDDELESYVKRGIEPVIVRPIDPGLGLEAVEN